MSSLPFSHADTFRDPKDFKPRRWQTECREAFFDRLLAWTAGQFFYSIYVGVGGGKTTIAAMIASQLLSLRHIDRVLFVSPNNAINRAVRRTFKLFGIHLELWNNQRHNREGEGAGSHGAIITYQGLMNCPLVQRHLVDRKRTLVIFDEIHHLGDKLTWAEMAEQAFLNSSAVILSLSGTPFRSDKRRIPFVTPLPQQPSDAGVIVRFRPDFSFNLGKCVHESCCKVPVFQWLNAAVDIPVKGVVCRFDSDNPPPPELAPQYLAAAVRPGSRSRLDALRLVIDECRRDGRKLIIFVGGSSNSSQTGIEDAMTLLPEELRSLGVADDEMVSVTSATKDAVDILDAFGKSAAWILISVNMVSEGVDIPELSAALFLSTVTAATTLAQRTGRPLRGSGVAKIWLFRTPDNETFVADVVTEITHEARAESPPKPDHGGDDKPRPRHPELARGVAACDDGLTVNGRRYTREQVDACKARIADIGLSPELGVDPHTDTVAITLLGVMFGGGVV